MSVDGDLFAVADDEQLAAVVDVVEASPAAVDVVDDMDGGDQVVDVLVFPEPWFAVTVLTLPNTDVWPIPAEFAADKVKVDLAGLEEKSMADTRALITETLPDKQLEEITERELARDKPRQAVLKATHAERERRGPRFANWVKSMAANPLTCRIAGIAWATVFDGVPRGICSHAVASREDEVSVLSDLRVAVESYRQGQGHRYRVYPTFCSWDLQAVFDVINTRLSALRLSSELFGPCYRRTGGDWIARGEQVGGLIGVAQGFGIEHSQVPYVPELMELFCAEPGSTQIADWAAQKLMLEVDLLKIVSRFG